MRNDSQLLLEVLDVALKLLPVDVPSFTKLNKYEPISNLRREPRTHASGLKARRVPTAAKGTQWLDIQALPLTKEDD